MSWVVIRFSYNLIMDKVQKKEIVSEHSMPLSMLCRIEIVAFRLWNVVFLWYTLVSFRKLYRRNLTHKMQGEGLLLEDESGT